MRRRQAVDAGHRHVADDDLRAEGVGSQQEAVAVGHDTDDLAFDLEQFAQLLRHRLVILGEQHSQAGSQGVWRVAGRRLACR